MSPKRRSEELEEEWALLYRSDAGSIHRYRCDRPGAEHGALPRLPTLCFVHHGVGTVRLRGRKRHLDANQALLITVPFHMRHLGCDGKPCATTVILSPAAARELAVRTGNTEGELHRIFSGRLVMRNPELQKKAHLLIHASKAGEAKATAELDRRLLQLFDEVVTSFSRQRTIEPFRRQGLARVRFYLSTRLEKPPTLDELAGIAGCTRFHLCRVFKTEAGVTITQYLHRLRLDEAVQELSMGANDLSTLAFSLGYSSHSHFTNRFRRYYGITPSAFRDELRRVANGATPRAVANVRSTDVEPSTSRRISDHPAAASVEVRQ